MKRKLALLLALIMVLSLVPATVFASTPNRLAPQWPQWNADTPVPGTGANYRQDLTFDLPLSALAGSRLAGSYIVLEVALTPQGTGSPGHGLNLDAQRHNFGAWATEAALFAELNAAAMVGANTSVGLVNGQAPSLATPTLQVRAPLVGPVAVNALDAATVTLIPRPAFNRPPSLSAPDGPAGNRYGFVQTAHVVIQIAQDLIIGADDQHMLRVTIPGVRSHYGNGQFNAWVVDGIGGVRGAHLTSGYVRQRGIARGRGFTAHYGDAVPFYMAAPLRQITIRERAMHQNNDDNSIMGGYRNATIRNLAHGAAIHQAFNPGSALATSNVMVTGGGSHIQSGEFTNSYVLRLTAPRGYEWRMNRIPELGGVGFYEETFNVTSELGIVQVVDFRGVVRRPTTHPNELYIIVQLGPEPSEAVRANRLDALRINGLWLLPSDGAPRTGNVNIDIHEMRVADSFPGVIEPPMIPINHANHRHIGLHVATRATDAVTWTQYDGDDGLVELISGTRGYDLDTQDTNWSSWARLQEYVPHALGTTLGNIITFDVVQEGVQIRNVQFRLQGGPGGGGAEWHYFRPYNREQRNMLPGTINRPERTRLHFTHTPNARDLRNLDVRFELSIEAGFVGKYGYDEILINASGVFGDLGTVPVATVRDPISLGEVETTWLEIGHTFYVTPTNVNDITIYEAEYGDIREGEFITLYTAWVHPGRLHAPALTGAGGLNLSMNLTPQVNPESGMVLSRGVYRVINAQTGQTRVEFEVLRASQGEPAVITFTDLAVSGQVFPGRDYYLVVSGSEAIAYNDLREHAGWGAVGIGDIVQTQWRGIFDTIPYGVQIIGWGEFNPDGEGAFERAESLGGVTFTTNVPFRGVDNPIIWRQLPGMTDQGGFVSMRAFAYAAGVDTDNIAWSGVTRVATVSGVNYLGQTVVISVTPDSPRATVTTAGIPTEVDIAMMADGLTGPEGTVRPIHEDGRIYLPLRFMFNVFGYSEFYTLNRVGNSAVIAAR